MKKIIFLVLIVICALAIIYSFFLPWAKASTSATRVAKSLTTAADTSLKDTPFAGKLIKFFDKATDEVASVGDVEIKTQVSGYDIPTLINKKTSKVAISLAQVFFKDTKDLDKKSMFVFLIPLTALICIALAVIGLRTNIAIIVMAAISGAIAVVGLYNLATIKLDNLAVTISIGQGLWQTMYAYLLICIIGVAWAVLNIVEAKK